MAYDLSVALTAITPLLFRAPIKTPVRTSFGTMRDRPMLLVRVEDSSGAYGWGEVWCNFPAVGAEHRARLLGDVFAPHLVGTPYDSPAAAFAHLEQTLATLAIQTGEPGPLSQCLAGLDIALWDLVARRNGIPIGVALGKSPRAAVPCYASGINPAGAAATAARAREAGHTAFKLKIGFGEQTDLANLDAIRADMATEERLMADANQAWSPAHALAMLPRLERHGLGWLEEPIAADAPDPDWRRLRDATTIPLAAGENIRGDAAFDATLAAGYLGVVQPDIAKWGGFSACAPLAGRILAAGQRYCPHWLGGGIGLAASAQLLAAAGGDGLLEVDVNDNPLREALLPKLEISAGRLALPPGPGLGVEPDLAALAPFRLA